MKHKAIWYCTCLPASNDAAFKTHAPGCAYVRIAELEQQLAGLQQELDDAHETLDDLGAPRSEWLDGSATDLGFRICEYAANLTGGECDAKV